MDIRNQIITFDIEENNNNSVSNICDLLVITELCKSKNEARNVIKSGGFKLNKEKITDPKREISTDDIKNNIMLIQKGKKEKKILLFDGIKVFNTKE